MGRDWDSPLPSWKFTSTITVSEILLDCCLLYPLDVIKTRLQVQSPIPSPLFPRYHGFLHAIQYTWKREGLRGFWKGYSFALLPFIPSQIIYYGCYEGSKKFFSPYLDHLPLFATCAFLAEAMSAIVWVPADVIAQRLQIQVDHSAVKSGREAARLLFQTEGIAGFYRGFTSSLLCYVPVSCVYWMSYESAKSTFRSLYPYNTSPYDPTATSIYFLLGSLSGCLGVTLSTPFDVTKTRLQTDSMIMESKGHAPGTHRYQGMFTTMYRIVAREGWRSLFKGGVSRLTSGFLYYGFATIGYEIALFHSPSSDPLP